MADGNDDMFDFTDLGEKLRGSGGRELAAASLARLRQLSEVVAAKRGSGLPPAEFSKFTAVSDALAAAESVMLRISSIMGSPSSGA